MRHMDFKHVIQDLTNVYIGANLSYDEMMNLDEVPFKLKTIISHYMLRDVMGDTTIANHIFYLESSSLSYLVFKQMKARFRMSVWQEIQVGKKKAGYVSKEYTIDQIVGNEELAAKKDQIIVEEMHLTKLSLLGVSI
ncbi:MAG: hypothetical protein R3Y24_01780 [Eubacteriales bacterium]